MRSIAAALLVVVLLGACGTKSGLYLPPAGGGAEQKSERRNR